MRAACGRNSNGCSAPAAKASAWAPTRSIRGRAASNGRPYDLILVFYGWEPQAGFADGLNLARDARGYIQTETATARTSLPDVYAIGEVANRAHPCVVTAMADGVVAAKDIQRRWERRPL